ncbi:polysaccharide deacetylase family protein [Aureibaculum sp. 2210JD6-5]|uniref:polysaccharide deacetylase family protein n=1 Tax=Aureibaculum sp. 2210JD6-5 TaxID=3103957 RepID=UPI002AAEE2C2|nr:polysaccharide deacetylase family protein [Aureibaculum sp. 2210JD6-5]MDY7396920.1 polysaccharide deacetylase family protein [Aureibaculum sp. 2210JD6-5]
MKNKFLFLFFISSFMLFAQPKVSFTFDDGSKADRPGYTFEEWNKMLLDNLEDANLKAVFFVTGRNKTDTKGKFLLKSWSDRGHKIANHTYTHPNYNNEAVSFDDFSKEIIKTDAIIKKYNNYIKLFRFPYLKEGNTQAKIDSIRKFLIAQDYKNGYVTIDASDWYVDSRLVERLKENPDADIEGFKEYYVNHLFEKSEYYEKLSYQLTGRHIKHTLLLHHNLAAALFLDDLIAHFKEKGWELLDADDAFKDPIFDKTPKSAGESLIWSLAKDSGKFENILNYPAEDSQYEKAKMDKLGL